MKLTRFVIAAVVTLSPFAAQAQFAKPEDAIKYRKAAFTVMGAHMGRVAPVVRGERQFNAAEVAANTAIIETMAGLPWSAFTAGSDKGDTRALPAIWANEAKFKASAEAAGKAIADLNAAAKAGNLDLVKTSFGAVGRACKACHDDFRKE